MLKFQVKFKSSYLLIVDISATKEHGVKMTAHGGTSNKTVNIARNRLGDLSSNPGGDCLHFTFTNAL